MFKYNQFIPEIIPQQNIEFTPEQELARQLSAMRDCMEVINSVIEDGTHIEYTHDLMNRNVQYIEIMLSKSEIQNSGEDLTKFTEAVTNGKQFLETEI